MKKITDHLLETNPDRVETFKTNAKVAFSNLLEGPFSDIQFFIGESLDPEAMTVVLIYKDDTPYLYFWKDGLEEEKVVG